MEPREFALLMICIGLFSLLMDTLQHRHDLNALRAQYADIPRSLGRVVAAMIAILGLLAMIAVIFRQ
jgi:putative membrane protein